MEFKFNTDLTQYPYREIPLWVIYALENYIGKRNGDMGGFLNAVLENDLSGAIARADEHSLRGLKGIVTLIYNHAPSTCWGSKDKVYKWVNNLEN